jgi:Cell wall-active antibiotics response 4TMS YvqF
VPTDDEIRRVAEDLRALAKSLARDVREAVDSARRDPRGLTRATRDELRQVRSDLRNWQRQDWRNHRWGDCGPARHGPTRPPRWDNWGRGRAGVPTGARESRPIVGPDGADAVEMGPSGRAIGHDDYRSAPPPVTRPSELTRRPRPPLRHRHDGSALLGLLAVVFGLAWLAAGTHILQLSAEGVLAVALMIVGATTVITARTDWALSRRAWPVLLGAGLVFALIVASVSPRFPGDIRHLRIGPKSMVFASWSEVPPNIDGYLGRTVVDFSGLPQPPTNETVQISGGVGPLVVVIPSNIHVLLHARVGFGSIKVPGSSVANGMSPSTAEELNAAAGGPILSLDINSRMGPVRILQSAPTTSPVTTSPVTTSPVTTSPGTTSPGTTSPGTTSPGTTSPPSAPTPPNPPTTPPNPPTTT